MYPYLASFILNNWRSSAPTATNIDVRSTSRCLWRNPCIKPSIVGRGGNGLVLHAPRPFCQKYSWKWCCQGRIHTIHRPLNQSNGQFLFRVDVWHQLKHAIFMFVSLFFRTLTHQAFTSWSCRTRSLFRPSPQVHDCFEHRCHTCRHFPIPNSHGCLVAHCRTEWRPCDLKTPFGIGHIP